MGMYTELVCALELERDTPQDVITILQYMTSREPKDIPVLPDHKLFKEESHWKYMLRMDSYYFRGDTNSTIKYDDTANFWTLTVRCNLKNYSSEIENLLDWIHPYVREYDNAFIGYTRYEETPLPTLIFYTEDQFKYMIPELSIWDKYYGKSIKTSEGFKI